jgi:cobalt-zinc-cadmium efflux system protein
MTDHKHSHDQGHTHDHSGHHHGNYSDHGWAFRIAIVLNSLFVVIELIYGFIAHSTALIADAGHNLFDVFSLILASWTAVLALRPANERYTYGLRSSSILAALANAMLLLVSCGAIAWEALRHLFEPVQVASLTVSVVATIGIVVNGFSAWLFIAGSKTDLNIRGAFLHMATDAAVSLGVVIAGIGMYCTGFYWIDPIVSLVIVAVIMVGTWQLLRDSINLSLNAVPTHIDIKAVREYLTSLPNVTAVHDLHIWGMSTKESGLTAHLVIPSGYPGDDFVENITHELEHRFSIHHSTLQVELGKTDHGCSLNPIA